MIRTPGGVSPGPYAIANRRTRADFERFSEMSETLETEVWMMQSDASCSPITTVDGSENLANPIRARFA